MHVTFCFCNPRWPRPLSPSLFILDLEVSTGLALHSLPPFLIAFRYTLCLSFSDEPHQELKAQPSAPRIFSSFSSLFNYFLPTSHNEDFFDNLAYSSLLQPLARIA